jgi:hypothetical protein
MTFGGTVTTSQPDWLITGAELSGAGGPQDLWISGGRVAATGPGAVSATCSSSPTSGSACAAGASASAASSAANASTR